MADSQAIVYSGTRLCVVPPGHPAPDRPVTVTIAPGAFGSGEHETTASCLEILEGLAELAGAQVLDLGSGTGILALAALKLGAAAATCVDTDAAAVATARRNAELNRVAARVEHVHGDLGAVVRGGFDVVVANLYADVLLAVAGELVGKVRRGGLLVLSGIAWEHDWDVRRRYARLGCGPVSHRVLGEFTSLVLRTD